MCYAQFVWRFNSKQNTMHSLLLCFFKYHCQHVIVINHSYFYDIKAFKERLFNLTEHFIKMSIANFKVI